MCVCVHVYKCTCVIVDTWCICECVYVLCMCACVGICCDRDWIVLVLDTQEAAKKSLSDFFDPGILN